MPVQPELMRQLARCYLSTPNLAKEVIGWAGCHLEGPFDSPAMRILAGLVVRQTDEEEVRTLLRTAIRELGFDVPTPDEVIEAYAVDMPVQPELMRQLARCYLPTANLAKEVIGWAGCHLEGPFDSPAMRILAGLVVRQTDEEEVRTLLRTAIRELGFDVPTPDEVVEAYAVDIARRVLAAELDSYDGAWEFYQVALTDGDRYRNLLPLLDYFEEHSTISPDAMVLEASRELLGQART